MGKRSEEILQISSEVAAITGTPPFVYVTSPTPGTTKWVFQEEICTSEAEALAYVKGLLTEAPARKAAELEALRPNDYVSTKDGIFRLEQVEVAYDEHGNIQTARARTTQQVWINLLTEGWKTQ